MLDVKTYKEIIDSFYKHLGKTDNKITGIKLTEDKWSLREIVGHLIDSASNNHQRFVRLQYDDLMYFPVYDADVWIKTQKYNSMDWDTLVTLWYSYNCLLINVVENADETTFDNVWVKNEDAIPFFQLINEYYKHLELHIKHFINRQEEIVNQ